MVRVGSELAKKKVYPILFIRKEMSKKVPLDSKSVDLALMSQSLHHAQHPEKHWRKHIES